MSPKNTGRGSRVAANDPHTPFFQRAKTGAGSFKPVHQRAPWWKRVLRRHRECPTSPPTKETR